MKVVRVIAAGRSRVLRGAVAAVAAVVIAAVAVPVLSGPAAAADNGLWSVFPTSDRGTNGQVRPYFVLDLRAGQTLRESVTVVNKTRKALTFRLYAADGLNLATGAFGLAPPQTEARDVGAWVRLPSGSLRVPARSGVAVPFVLQVPPDARPGDHFGGVVAVSTEVEKQAARAGAGARSDLGVLQSVGTRVYARVAGKVAPALAITSMSVTTSKNAGASLGASTDVVVTYTVANTGNVRLAPRASVRVSSLGGLSEKSVAPRALPEMLPGSRLTFSETVSGLRPLLRLTASVTVVDGTTSASGEQSSLVIPWLLLLALAVVAFVLWVRRRRRRTVPTPAASPEPVLHGAAVP